MRTCFKNKQHNYFFFFFGWTGPYSCWLCLLWTTIMDHVLLTGAGVIYNLLCDITSSCKRCTFILWHTRMWECSTMRWWSGLGYLRPDWEFHWFLKRDQHITGRVVREGKFFSSMFWSVTKRGSYTWLAGCQHSTATQLAVDYLTSHKVRNIVNNLYNLLQKKPKFK